MEGCGRAGFARQRCGERVRWLCVLGPSPAAGSGSFGWALDQDLAHGRGGRGPFPAAFPARAVGNAEACGAAAGLREDPATLPCGYFALCLYPKIANIEISCCQALDALTC